MASNKNYIVEQIYVISSDVTAQRINLRKFDSRKVELEEKIDKLMATEHGEDQAGYELKKSIKNVQKELDQNETLLEKTEDLLENMEEKCQHFQQELEDSIDYKLPLKIG